MTSNVFLPMLIFIIKFQYQNTYPLYKKKTLRVVLERYQLRILRRSVCRALTFALSYRHSFYAQMLEMRLKKHRSHSKYSWKKTGYPENAFKLISSSVNVLLTLPKNDEALTDFQQEEAVAKRCSVKKVFLEISQNL